MSVNPLSNIANPFVQSLTSTALSVLNGKPANSGTTNASGSPFAQVMSSLQQLQQSSPSQYQSLTGQIAANLQSASQSAQACGNTGQAQELGTLAADFQNASANNQLPNAGDLEQAMAHAGHHHHLHLKH